MKKYKQNLSLPIILIFIFSTTASAQNPFITNQYSADPSARVFGDRVYVFPSHDILAAPGKGRPGWFCMEDYHVFSSANLIDWTDHGMIVQQNKVPWVRPNSYSMWAPDCIYRNGKYYFYFPTSPQDTITYGRGFTIGVAVADKPEGPYIPESTPVKGVRGIDPNVFIDKDGQAYLYWSAGNIYGAKLKDNMLELASEVKTLGDLPTKGLKEGPHLFERNGIYYLTYPHVENRIERLEYAVSDNPLGPFRITGVVMDESPSGCWTNHQSIIQFKGQWYLFYHDRDYSPKFDKARSARIDSLFFNADGTIKKITPTLRGVGLTEATNKIQIDRYSDKGYEGVAIDFIDTTNRFLGWKTIFAKAKGWVQYNSIDFGKKQFKSVNARVLSPTGGILEIRLDNINNPAIAEIEIPGSNEWSIIKTALSGIKSGVHHLFVSLKDDKHVEADWISFE
ncbi:MAG TPA: family 43 glycosylhydrolase [Chitinophagaceae bacterium]|nr:family 43 glycosylhydrolase [Chitinophagaceae bacterium]